MDESREERKQLEILESQEEDAPTISTSLLINN